MTTQKRTNSSEEKLVELLSSRSYTEPGPARWEFEKRRLVARLGEERAPRPAYARLSWSRKHAMPLFAGASALAGAAVFLILLMGEVPVSERPVMVAGAWTLTDTDGLVGGQAFEVEADARAVFTLPDSTSLWLSDAAAGSFEADNLETLELDQGRLVARVTKQLGGRIFAVRTPHATVQVLGTTFAVVVEEGQTRVRLHEGLVRVAYGADSVLVEPGHQVAVTAGGLQEMDQISNEEAVADLQLTGQPGWQSWLPEPRIQTPVQPIATLSDTAGPEAQPENEVAVSEPAVLDEEAQPTKEIPVAKRRRMRRPARIAAKPVALLTRVKGLYAERSYDKIVGVTDGDDLSGAVRIYRARAMEKLGRRTEAVVLFGALADENGPQRAEASYLAAKLLFQMKNFVDSREYAARVSAEGGPMAEPAAFLAIQSLIAAGTFNEAFLDCQDYLNLYPSGLHSEDVLFLSGFSRMQTGATRLGTVELVNYLNRYPSGRHAEKARKLLGR